MSSPKVGRKVKKAISAPFPRRKRRMSLTRAGLTFR